MIAVPGPADFRRFFLPHPGFRPEGPFFAGIGLAETKISRNGTTAFPN
jgi:hypothetical protein